MAALASIQQRDFVARSDDTLGQNYTVDSSFAFMVASQAPHDLGICLCRVWIKCDHLATRIAFDHRDRRLRANT